MKDTKELVEYVIHKSQIKAEKKLLNTAILSFMAGAFIALGAVANIVVSADLYAINTGLAKFAGAAVFPVGLISIILLGYELFTSNTMVISAAVDKKITYMAYFKNILFVLFFNFIGCLFIAYITFRTHTLSETGKQLLFSMAEHKVHASAYEIFLKGILCNVLVCGSALIAYASKEGIAKIFGIWFPIMLFIVLGYDHIVANMLYLPTAYMLKSGVTISQIAYNFLFSGIGNFVGGVFFMILPLYITVKYNGELNAKN
ncbi:formate/nitrite transporter family protein [Oceanivirga salmonicida]|uniref:formate/nitrite transporter family protein n=1 Tax=Oceanivirga salmonicida TaxID=1769291 RepID=UPI000834F820|nr:formate/nitrite transporter family protein [Oceanivirga salmonicida]